MKETYYKIYDQRGRLALVTPTPALVNEWLKENEFTDENLNFGALSVGYSKWLNNKWRVTKVLI